MKPFVVYTVLRILLFFATWGIVIGIWALVSGQADLLVTLIIAFIVSGIASYALLNGPRSRFAERVQARADRMVSRFDELRAREDAEAAQAARSESPSGSDSEEQARS